MKNIKKPVFFIVFLLILAFSYTAIFGVKYQYGDIAKTYIKEVSDIRLGIDIQGGVDVTFTPADGVDATEKQLDSVKEVMKVRLAALGITDSNVYVDNNNDRIIVRFPWQSSETDFDPEAAVKELGGTAMLTFREGTDTTTDENGETVPSGPLVLNGDDVDSATAGYQKTDAGDIEYVVSLKLKASGAEKFSEATGRLSQDKGQISIWMDNTMISAPTVQAHITNGEAIISGSFETYDDADALANKINSGSLPFSLTTSSFSTISPTLGAGALRAMIIGGLIAFAFIAVYMIVLYRLPGFVAVIALLGQVTFTLAAVSGYFSFMNSSTLTIPGIAGIILSIGMGVDANIITAERIKEELRAGKRLNTALEAGYKRAFSAIFDGNLTVILIAIILMGAFGVPDSLFAKLLSPVFRWFGTTTEGTIYSFGFTLTVGAILNFVMGVWASRLMLGSLSKFKLFKNKKLYGGTDKPVKAKKILNFTGKSKVFYGISLALIALSVVLTFIGVDVAIEFKGGTMINYSFVGEINDSEAEKKVEEITGANVNVQQGDLFQSDRKKLSISFVSNEGFTAEKQAALTSELTSAYPDCDLEILDSTDVAASSGRNFFIKCIVAVIFSAIVLILYIALRFKRISGWSSGICAVLALLHDIVITYGAFVLMGFQINSNFVAVVLTILGCSINDTIVVYDRIRENRKLMPSAEIHELVNTSSTQSITRSFRTTVTTVATMIIISVVAYIFGVTSILSFSIPISVGMIVGTYSSLCIASTLWVTMQGKKAKKKA